MPVTPYADIDELLYWLQSEMQRDLESKLLGLYLYGSLVAGDFERGRSDIDLLAVLSDELSESEFERIQHMHERLVQHYPQWDNRIEVAYLSQAALQTYASQQSTIAIISPGEPFHFKQAGREFLLNWYLVRESGLPLLGPPAATLIAPSTREDFLQVIAEHVIAWRDWAKEMRTLPAQAYTILTLCRALYTFAKGEQTSKKRAALWAAEQFPAWAPLIEKAMIWKEGRQAQTETAESAYPDTLRFVDFVIDHFDVSMG